MDRGRYRVHQGWDNNSALEGYGAAHDPNFRVGKSYDDRKFIDQINTYPHDVLERENYAPPSSAAGLWPDSRKRINEGEYPRKKGSRQHDRPYADDNYDIDAYRDREVGTFEGHEKRRDGYRSVDNYHDHEYDWPTRVGIRNHNDYIYDDHGKRNRYPHQHSDGSRERDHGYGHNFDSDYDRRGWREGPSRRRDYCDREHDKRTSSMESDHSSRGRYRQSHSRSRSRSHSPSRSRSYGRDDHLKSRSPHGRSGSHRYREDSYGDGWRERSDKQRVRDEKCHHEAYAVIPSATVVVKGLSQKTTEEDLYQILAEWGPLRHVRVIKERMSGLSRGFAFIDFPSVESAKAMMDQIGEDGLVVDGRKILFGYSSKPTGSGGAFTQENYVKSGHGNRRSMIVPFDWMCIICGCINFARRTSCFQCNEPRGDDAPAADMLSSQATLGRRGLKAGPTHVLVVRGLDESADEEMLRYEFSKHAPIKDIRLVRDKFTHVSRGFAFVHFHSVEEATKALEATNGTALEKNGQMLRVAYAKNVIGPGSGASAASSQSISLAAAAIEAAAFSQQYDAVGWAPKEYNPEGKEADSSGQGLGDGSQSVRKDGSARQSGFVWDEASGYYFDASSGFYYDGNTGLYYDGNNAIWYSFDDHTQQYIPCNDQSESKQPEPSKGSDTSTDRKEIISAPAATITSSEKASLPDTVQAAAAAAIAAEKKEKEKMKEIKLASKSSILANKKKMNNVLTMWKQRNHEGGQATRIALDEGTQLSTPSTEDKTIAASQSDEIKPKAELTPNRNLNDPSSTLQSATSDLTPQPRTIGAKITGGTLMGVIRGGSGRRVVNSAETLHPDSSADASSTLGNVDIPATPFKTDISALGVYSTPSAAVSVKRRFSETPLSSASASNHREPPHSVYRDRAAERRRWYGSSSGVDDLSDLHRTNLHREPGFKKDSMPFPPGVGGGSAPGDSSYNAGPSYDVITADKAIDESNVGNRMLRNMGWQEGLGLGKDGSGIVEPVQAQAVDSRAGLGSHQKKVTDPSLEVQPGDSYRTLIHKTALARFRDMS